MLVPSLRRLALALLVGFLCIASPGHGRSAGSGEAIDALLERAEQVFDESVAREDVAAAAAFASALDDVEAALASAGPEALGARLAFLDHWVEEAGSTAAGGPLGEVLLDRATGYARELLGMLRSDDVPEEAWDQLQRETGFGSRPQLFALWLGSEPRDTHLLAALAETASDESLRLALFRAASATLDPRGAQEAEVLARRFLQERLRVLLGMGLAEEALQELEAAPEHRRRHLLAAPRADSKAVEVAVPGEPLVLEHRDLRLDLAAAYALRGETARAAELLSALDVTGSPSGSETQERVTIEGERVVLLGSFPGAETPVLQRRSLAWLLSLSSALAEPPPEDDPFDHFMDLLSVRSHSYSPQPLWRRVEAELAEVSGYPDLAAHLLAEACRRLGPGYGERELEQLTALGPFLDAVGAELGAIDETLAAARMDTAAALDRIGRAVPWVQAAGCPDSSPPVMKAEPGPSMLPPGVGIEVLRLQGSLSEGLAASFLAAPAVPVVLPDERQLVAVLHGSGETLAVALPASSGEDYLIFRSHDAGASWGPPHATGMEVRSPFEIVAGSPRNRRIGDELVLEAVVWNRSDSVPGLEEGPRVLLSIPVEALLADSDGDGLTDLEERAIHTDPREADTDGDGIDDDLDRLTVRGAAGSGNLDTERVLTLVLEEVLFPRAWSDRRERCLPESLAADGTIPSWQTSWVVGAGMPLAPLSRPERVVRLDEEPVGTVHPVFRVTLFFFDQQRSRAFVKWWLSEGEGRTGYYGSHLLVRADERPEGWRLSKGVRAGGCMIRFEDYDHFRIPG